MPMVSISPDLYALNCKKCSKMVNWILVELENDNFSNLVFGFWVFQNKCVFPNENMLGFHLRYCLFLD